MPLVRVLLVLVSHYRAPRHESTSFRAGKSLACAWVSAFCPFEYEAWLPNQVDRGGGRYPVLIGAGIGVTPYASVFESLVICVNDQETDLQ